MWQAFVVGLCIAGSIASWVTTIYITQSVTATYDKPLFIGFMIRSMWSVTLVVYAFVRFTSRERDQPRVGLAVIPPAFKIKLASCLVALAFMNVVGGCLSTLALHITSAPTNAVILQLNTAFVFAISACFLGEKVCITKILAVFICFTGVVLAVLSSSTVEGPKDTTLGVVLCFVATVTDAIHATAYELMSTALYSRGVQRNRALDPLLFAGCLGLAVATTTWPLLMLADVTGIEKFELPPDTPTWVSLIENALLNTSCNVFFVVGVAFSSAITVSAGLQLVVPTTYAVNAWVRESPIMPGQVCGSGLLIAGLVWLQYSRRRSNQAQEAFNIAILTSTEVTKPLVVGRADLSCGYKAI